MYADREEAETNRSIKDRLNGNTSLSSTRRSSISGKRGREDDHKWKHDLFEHNGPQVSKRRIGENDLRFKVQKKSIQPAAQSVKGSFSGGVRDLREKLSGIDSSHSMDTEPTMQKQKPVSEVSKRTRKSVNAQAPVTENKKVASSVSKKNAQRKDESVDSFLQSLDLDKYSITFQAEEVDMATLIHMTDDDLKAMGIPMGPRKKILLALESKV